MVLQQIGGKAMKVPKIDVIGYTVGCMLQTAAALNQSE